jgi:heme-degrading monooxygenase HmoA
VSQWLQLSPNRLTRNRSSWLTKLLETPYFTAGSKPPSREAINMIHEIVIQTVDPAKRAEYIDEFGQTLRDADFAGSHGIKLFTSIEDPSRVILIIEWDSVESHTRHRGTPAHNHMREVGSKYQTAKSEGAHFLLHEVKS